jgi:hypothetical protein
VLLYTPVNGLDARLHEYVRDHWWLLNRLTGESCLLVALEDPEGRRPIEDFNPGDVYDIARYLGVAVSALPCVIFFAAPAERSETLVLKLKEFLPGDVDENGLTDFFRDVQALVDGCAERGGEERLGCLGRSLEREWPRESRWAPVAARTSNWIVASTARAGTVATSIASIVALLQKLGLGFG